MERKFYAKILLFGEYSLMTGSMALTLPFTGQRGWLTFPEDATGQGGWLTFPENSAGGRVGRASGQARYSGQALRKFWRFLSRPSALLPFPEILDLDRFAKDLDNGLYFESDIQSGYGMGSSGALTAAVYHRYARKPAADVKAGDAVQLQKLKDLFAAMEGHFHGQSSGIDPLTSYMELPLLVESPDSVRIVKVPASGQNEEGAFYLRDTGLQRKTSPLVSLFQEKYTDEHFKKIFHAEYVPLNNRCISAVLDGEGQQLETHMRQLSALQLRIFREMIPEHLIAEWKQGVKSGTHSMKLCGAGGGGYILVYSNRNPGGGCIPIHLP